MFIIERIRQEEVYDCSQACISMLTKIPLKLLNDMYDEGMTKKQVYVCLKNFGVQCSIPRFNEVKVGKVYIATVASAFNYLHCLVIDNRFNDEKSVFDPASDNEGKPIFTNRNLSAWCDMIQVSPKYINMGEKSNENVYISS